MRKIWFGISTIALLFFLCLAITWGQNETMKQKFSRGIAREKYLPKISLLQRYVKTYNLGDIYYANGEYDLARMQFEKALSQNPPKKRSCDIRVNLALSMTTPITPESVTADNLDETISTLEDAIVVLTEDGCANDTGFGHSYRAQVLKNDIEEYIEQLKQQVEEEKKKEESKEESNESNSTGEDGQTEAADPVEKVQEGLDQDGEDKNKESQEGEDSAKDEKNVKAPEKENEEDALEEALKKQFDEMQQQGGAERGQRLESYQNWGNYSFGIEKNW